MTPRMNIFQAAPDAMKAMVDVEKAIEASGLEHSLLELVKIRASQLNGCAFCIHMHTSDAIKAGENPTRIFLLDAWRDSTAFSDRERAALNWTEKLGRVSKFHAADEDYEILQAHFDDREIAYLTTAVAAINFWNRVQVGLKAVHPAVSREAIAA